MTKIEEHCVSLELAKKLKEAGWKQEGIFWWGKMPGGWLLFNHKPLGITEHYPAPLVTEILEELPKINGFELRVISKGWGLYDVGYWEALRDEDERRFDNFNGSILPNSLAEMWLHLKQEKLI